MSIITILEWQTNPAAILARISAGEHLLVVNDGQPLAEIRPVQNVEATQRPHGLCQGEFVVPDNFDAPLPDEIIDLFEDPITAVLPDSSEN